MNKEEITEGNKLIAEFMGGTILPSGVCDNYNKLKLPRWAFVMYNFDTLKVSGYEYHTSWDWLMPVVEKISIIEFHTEMQDLGNGKIETIIYTHYPLTFGMLNNETGKPMFRFLSCGLFEADTLIEAAWLAVVEFIK